jgi:hypothetical protein
VHPSLPEIEHRFLVEPGEARAFLGRVADHLPLDVHDRSAPISFVRTTYHDTDDLQLFRAQLRDGRRRVRIREYAGAPDMKSAPRLTGVCALELKEQRGESRRKVRLVATPAEIAALVRPGCEVASRGAAPAALQRAAAAIRRGQLRPRLTTWFRRVSRSGEGVRITLDERILFARPVAIGAAGELAEPASPVGRGPHMLLEVKLTGPAPGWLAAAMADLLLVTQFSKFRDGMLAAHRAEATATPMPVMAAPDAGAGPPLRAESTFA